MCATISDSDWRNWTDAETVNKRAGGRRRYNAERRRAADERRQAMAEALDRLGIMGWKYTRYLAGAFAEAFGVSRTTAWRDLKYIMGAGISPMS